MPRKQFKTKEKTNMKIKGKVAIVTGASSGIGLATARLLTKNGVKVALVARSKEKLEKISKELPESVVAVADMSKVEEVTNMVKVVKGHFGRIDILINNAGQGYDAMTEKTDLEIFHQLFDLDVVGPLASMQQVIPIMREQKEGVIINISSGTALMYLPNMGAYSALKRALGGISLTAREELKKDNISVGVVYPYMTDTDFEKNTIKGESAGWQSSGNGDFQIPKADPPEMVAEKILEAIIDQKAETFVREMKDFRTG
jgi:short-subunit dehydrogenase